MIVDDGQAPNQETLTAAAMALKEGRLVAMPTETVYGLAADAGSKSAVTAIYSLKGRPADHPLIVHVSSADRARQWGRFSKAAMVLADAFWPGPMTLICPLRDGMPNYACGGHPTVGLRVPAHPVAQSLLQAFESLGGLGVAAPSANRFGRISPTRASHVRDDYGHHAPLILDGGRAQLGLESTIIDVSTDQVRLLRPGTLEVAQLAQVLGIEASEIRLPDNAPSTESDKANLPAAPGTLAAHYAPMTPLTLVSANEIDTYVRARLGQYRRLAVYSITRFPCLDLDTQAPIHWHQMPAKPAELAHRLYDDLRHLDTLKVDELIVQIPPTGLGFAAIFDRLTRAQTGSGQNKSDSND